MNGTGDTRTIILDDPAQLPGVYAALQTSLNAVDFQQVFTERIFPEIERVEHGFFDSETGPSGAPWAPLAQSTIDKKHHDLILWETGRLEDSVTGQTGDSVREAGAREMAFGTNRPFAGVHQDGSGNIPQREFLGFNDELLTFAVDVIADDVIRQISGN